MHTPVVVLLSVLLLAGCASTHQAIPPETQNELILLTPLPPLTSYAVTFGVRLNALFTVLPDGTTKEVFLVQSSGDPEWDSAAIDSLKQWRFTPAASAGEPTNRRIRYAIVVQVQEPTIIRLAEMVVPDQRKADSLVTLLQEGADFDSLAAQALRGGPGGYWRPPEPVNLARYPGRVREILSTLRTDQVTGPIRIGLNYMIFKRYRSAR